MKLLTSQKDQIFDIIENSKLSPSQFELKETKGSFLSNTTTTMVVFKNSRFYFKFESGPGENKDVHYCIFSPGSTTFIEEGSPVEWSYQLMVFNDWLKYLSRELHSPNKWERLQKEIDEIKTNYSTSEEKFTIQEFEDLKIKINLLKSQINDIGLSKDQIQGINIKLDYLIESAKTLSKLNWQSLFIGTIITVTIQLGLTPENSKSLWELIKHAFNQLFLN